MSPPQFLQVSIIVHMYCDHEAFRAQCILLRRQNDVQQGVEDGVRKALNTELKIALSSYLHNMDVVHPARHSGPDSDPPYELRELYLAQPFRSPILPDSRARKCSVA
jgi:hypothetical protein